MEQLWAPWRMEYINRATLKEQGCVICNYAKNDKKLLVHKGKNAHVMMNLYPYNNGHVMVSPLKHIAAFDEIEEQTQSEIMTFSNILMRFMRKEFSAEGLNIGANIGKAGGAGIDDHFHFHVVPRWSGDTNFMPIIGQTKVQVDSLESTCEILKKAFL